MKPEISTHCIWIFYNPWLLYRINIACSTKLWSCALVCKKFNSTFSHFFHELQSLVLHFFTRMQFFVGKFFVGKFACLWRQVLRLPKPLLFWTMSVGDLGQIFKRFISKRVNQRLKNKIRKLSQIQLKVFYFLLKSIWVTFFQYQVV